MKKAINLIFPITLLLVACATRTFYINSDPSNARILYQTRNEKVLKGYTPIIFKDNPENITPATKIIFEKEGYEMKSVNVGGFEGDVSIHVELEKKIEEKKEIPIEEKKEEIEKEETVKAEETKQEVPPKEIPSDDKEFVALQEKLKNMEKLLSEIKGIPQTDQTSPQVGGETVEQKANEALKRLFEAQKLVQANKLNDALAETFKAIAINDKFAYAYALQGSIYFLKKDYYQAVKAWEKSIELDPANTEVLNILNKARARLGERF
jgi:tetratricopeptide (TPR) repeat protein